MEQGERRLCRLCLSTISNGNFEDIGEAMIKTLEVLQLTFSFDIEEGHVVCSNCMASIQKYLDFKSAYLNAEDYIVSLYNFETESKLDLREVYVHKNKHMVTAEIARDQEICRLCMELNESSSCKPLLEIEGDMLEKCIPELNFNLTKEPVLCDSCLNSLKLHFQFLQTCTDTEEKIIEYCRFEATGSKSKINLNKVVKFTRNILENERSITKVNVDLDRLPCESKENNIIRNEIKVENENEKFDREDDTKTDIKENIKIEVSENSIELQNGELDMIYEQNFDLDGLCCKSQENNGSAEFNGENDIKPNVEENTKKKGTNEDSLKLQPEELEMIYKQNGVQTKQTDFKSFRGARILNHLITKNTNVCNPDHMVTYQVSLEEIPQNLENVNKIKIAYNYRNPSEVKVYTCKSCSYVAKCEDNFKRHMLIHEQITLHRCNQCSYETKYKHVLKIHMLTHEQPTIFKCESCAYETQHEGTFKSHVQLYHELSEKYSALYKCHHCSFQTKSKQSLESHLIPRNVSEVPVVYSCNRIHCSYTTKNKMALIHHMSMHQERSKVKMFNCRTCSYATNRKDCLKNHIMKVHLLIYKCRQCSFQTKNNRDLKIHSLTHLEPKGLDLILNKTNVWGISHISKAQK